MRRGFTLLEVLLAAIILGSGLAAILVSMSQAQRMMLASSRQETAQEVMDLGEMAYPLADVKDPDSDLDVPETKAEELWEKITDVRMTGAQREKFHGYTWEREALNRKDSEEDIKRLGNLYTVRVTVRWGDRFRGNGEKESYVTFWRKSGE
ncbi:MAG: prepilin-type N-terminal cleavage/methylation domain-containing protein [Kiritimatiellae bacterium]|nr:prepilin-type N-terminal cleavage/methylation domain-containing protein [Kiritimatiellia bacterium]